jgi:hypothetical protein
LKCEGSFQLKIEFQFLIEKGRPQRLDVIFNFFRLRTSFFKKTTHQAFNIEQTQHPRRDGEQEQVRMCCLEATVCFSYRRTKCALTVSWRRPGKLGCRSNSPSLCAAQATSHVSSELCTFRCLLGHVCQRCAPVSRNTVGTMVDVCQVMVAHTIICKIQTSRLTTLVRNESRCSCSYTEILVFLTMKMELPSPLLSDSPFLSSE